MGCGWSIHILCILFPEVADFVCLLPHLKFKAGALGVAVGTTIADRPPHRTVRSAFPHTAPTLEGWREVLLLAHRSILGTLYPRTVSSECWTERCSPWPAPFSPQAPPKIALLCSSGSAILGRGPTPPERACPPCGFAPSRTGLAPLRAEAL